MVDVAEYLSDEETRFEGYSISHAAVLDPETGAEKHSFYGVRELSRLDLNLETGKGRLEIRHAFLSFAALADIWGIAPVPGQLLLPLRAKAKTWPVAVRIPAKQAGGDIYTMDFILYQVSLRAVSFTASYKDGMGVIVRGKVRTSMLNHCGRPNGIASFGHILATPGVLTGEFQL